MADLYYYEDGYIDAKYHVYTADPVVGIAPYIVEGYFDNNYYEAGGAVFSLTAELTLRPGETVSATGSWTSAFTQTTAVGRLQQGSAAFTSAFSPTLTVDAFKNAFAILDATTALSSIPVATRSTNVILSHIADLNAMAAKTAKINSTISATATLSSAPTKSVVSSATLNTAITLSCLAYNVTFFDAQIASSSRLTTSRYFGTGRPRNALGITSYTTSDKKFGTASISGNFTAYSETTLDLPSRTTPWCIEFWIKAPTLTTKDVITFSQGGTGSKFITIGITNAARLRLTTYKAAKTTTLTSGSNYNYTGWTHVAVVYDPTPGLTYAIAVYADGTRFIQEQISNFDPNNQEWTGYNTATTFNIDVNSIYVDDVRVSYDTPIYDINNNFTAPSSSNTNDPDTTQLLWHLDQTNVDDISVQLSGSAALPSSATIAVTATKFKGAASAALTSTATLSANAGKLQIVSVALTAAVTQSTTAVKTVQAVITLSSSVAVTATAYRTKQFVSNQNALFTPSITCQAQLAGVALLETQFTQSTSAVKTARTITAISAVATLSSSMTVTAGLAANLTSVSTVTATAYRIQTFASALSSAGTLTCDFVAFNNVSAALSTAVTVTANIDHLVGYVSSMTSAVTMTSDLKRIRLTSSTQTSTATVSITAYRIQSAESALSSVATQTTLAVKTASISSSISTAFTQTATPVKTVNAIPHLESIATQLTVAYQNATGTISLTATATVTALVGVIRQFVHHRNQGINALGNPKILLSGLPYSGLAIARLGFTASIWAKRATTTTYSVLWSDTPQAANSGVGLIIDNNNIRLRQYGDADEPGVTWPDLAPVDTNWHHYLLFAEQGVPGATDTNSYQWRLWLDGVDQGLRNGLTPNGALDNSQYINLGHGIHLNQNGNYDEATTQDFNINLAQIWIGYYPIDYPPAVGQPKGSFTFDPSKFYDGGYVDLGTNGRGEFNQLPSPYIYDTLDAPWTNVTFDTDSIKPAVASLPYNDLTAQAQFTITPSAVLLNTASISVTATQTTLISYVIRPVIAFTSSATLTLSATAFTGYTANLTSRATQTITVKKYNSGVVRLNSSSTLQAVPGFFDNFSANLTTAATLVCDFNNIPPKRGEAALLSTVTLVANARSFSDNIILEVSAFTLAATATIKIPIRATANLTTTATLSVIIGSREQFAALIASSGTLTTQVTRTRVGSAVLSCQATLIASGSRLRTAQANLTAFNTVLTAGEVINLDPYLTITIEPESRLWKIDAESRIIVIEQETRVNIV